MIMFHSDTDRLELMTAARRFTLELIAGSAGWLSVVESGQCGDDGDCLLAANEDAACFCFGCREDDILQGFANDLYGAVERREFGGGFSEVEDASNATACLGEDEVRYV